MNIKDLFWLSYKDLGEKKVRTALTIVMVMIGVASIVALVSQTQGVSASIQSSLESLGPTSIIVTSSGTTGFTVVDEDRIYTLSGVNTIIPIVEGQVSVVSNGQNTSATLLGITTQGLQQLLGTVNLYQGTLYNDTLTPSSVIGYDVAFPSSDTGQSLQVGEPATLRFAGRTGETYTVPVVGVFQPYGSSLISVDSAVVMSLPEAEELLHRDTFSLMIVKATNTSDVAPIANVIESVYGSSARVTTTQQLIATTASIIGSITLLLGVVAGISLLVAAIGIMNIMLIAVFERTHEIGIYKSIGFKRKHIMLIFVLQALMIGFMGGVVGVILGAGASYGLSFVLGSASSTTPSTSASTGAGARTGSGGFSSGGGATFSSGSGSSSSATTSYQPVFTPETIVAALLVAMLVSLIAGVYPAWRASRMEPIDALRQL